MITDPKLFIPAVLGKKMKVWERQLMKDFHLAPVGGDDDIDQLMQNEHENEDPLDRFRRVAKLAVLKSCAYKWTETIDAACQVWVAFFRRIISL